AARVRGSGIVEGGELLWVVPRRLDSPELDEFFAKAVSVPAQAAGLPELDARGGGSFERQGCKVVFVERRRGAQPWRVSEAPVQAVQVLADRLEQAPEPPPRRPGAMVQRFQQQAVQAIPSTS